MTSVINPSPESISKYIEKWSTLENYILQEQALNHLFQNLCPTNNKIEDVLLKVSALNDFYSTNIFDTYTVAKHILNKNIDSRLRNKDYSLINDIAQVTIKGKTRNFYSFASKYCSHHKPDDFPIYDSFVEKMLMHYRKVNKFHKFRKKDLKIYDKFIEIISTFQRFYSLNNFSLRQIDIFLWLAGKEFFPKNYTKS
jgi:hypothetical protein